MTSASVLLTALVCVGTAGCWLHKKPAAVALPLTLPQTAQPGPGTAELVPPPAETEPPALTALPETELAAPALPPAETPPPAQAVLPTAPPPAKRTGRTQAPPAAVSNSGVTTPPAAARPPAPQLGEILSAERLQQLHTSFNQRVASAKAARDKASGAKLSGEQQETVARIRTFLNQAEAAEKKDPVTALQLALRADLLGADLLDSLK
jgi:hypothetical protein